MIGRLVRANHARRHVLQAAPLDPPRRPLTERVAIEQQRHHRRGIVRRPPMPVRPISREKRGQIELRHRVNHKPREVILRQPLTQARRQQQLLLAITRQEVLRHAGIVLITSDRPPLCATASMEGDSESGATAFHGCESEAGADRAPAYACCSSRAGVLRAGLETLACSGSDVVGYASLPAGKSIRNLIGSGSAARSASTPGAVS
jgi:hypothetical protein